jgi:DNA repair protein SbcD/Mre11
MSNTNESFTFVHAADLHLGSPLTGLAIKDEEIARRFSEASRNAFSELINRAIDLAVAFVVVAGDVYDGDWKDNTIGLYFNREIARLHRAGIALFLLKGNHDAESIITKTIPLPETVQQFPSGKVHSFRIDHLKVVLHGRSFAERAATENYALGYPAPVSGWFNIGVLHTSCTGRLGHANYAPCTVADLAARRYHYWALGHVHEFEEVSRDPWIVFPGNLQGRSVRECGPKGAVLVEVTDGEVSQIKRLIIDSARWASIEVSLSGIDTERDMLDAIKKVMASHAEEAANKLLAMRVTLTGTTSLHRHLKSSARRLVDEVQAIAHHVGDDVWVETLRVNTRDPSEPSASVATASFDLPAILGDLASRPEVLKAAEEIVAEVRGKLPEGLAQAAAVDGDLATLLEEARLLVLGRAASNTMGD